MSSLILLFQFCCSLGVFFLLSNDTTQTIHYLIYLHLKEGNNVYNNSIACLVLVGCTVKIFDTWLKTLLIFADILCDSKETVVVLKTYKEKTSEEESNETPVDADPKDANNTDEINPEKEESSEKDIGAKEAPSKSLWRNFPMK